MLLKKNQGPLKLQRFMILLIVWLTYLLSDFFKTVLVIFTKNLAPGQKCNSCFTVVPKDRNSACLRWEGGLVCAATGPTWSWGPCFVLCWLVHAGKSVQQITTSLLLTASIGLSIAGGLKMSKTVTLDFLSAHLSGQQD